MPQWVDLDRNELVGDRSDEMLCEPLGLRLYPRFPISCSPRHNLSSYRGPLAFVAGEYLTFSYFVSCSKNIDRALRTSFRVEEGPNIFRIDSLQK